MKTITYIIILKHNIKGIDTENDNGNGYKCVRFVNENSITFVVLNLICNKKYFVVTC